MKAVAKLSAWGLILLPVLLLLVLVYHYAETVFFADDFHLLKTIVWGQEAHSLSDKFGLLIQQHNEHRIVVPRLLTWLDYKLEGHIDWPALMLFGNLLWCGILFFLWDAFKRLDLNPWFFLPVPWLLFQPAYYDNYTWSISVLQQSVIVFLLAWLVYAFVNGRYLLAIFIFLIGTFTHGNGIFGIAVGVVFLVLSKDWKWLAIWLTVCLTTAAFYFHGFEKGQNADFLSSFTHPVQMFGYFLAFLGSAAEVFGAGLWPSVIWGLVAFGGIAWYGFPKIRDDFRAARPLIYFDKVILGNLVFLSITALLVAVSRSWTSPELDIPPRYAHYSPYFTGWFYLVGLAVLRRPVARYWAMAWGIGAVALNLISHLNYLGELEYRRDWLRADLMNWRNYETFVQYPPSFNDNIREVYSAALARGICRPSADLLNLATGRVVADSSIVLRFEKVAADISGAGEAHFEKELLVTDSSYAGAVPFLVLIPVQGPPVWLPFYRGRNGYRKMLTNGAVRNPEIWSRFMTDNLPAGRYKIGYQSDDSFRLTKYRLEVGADHTTNFR